MLFSIVAISAFASGALAADHLVKVGASGGLVFEPTSITVAQGDSVSFQFQGKNHTVTQSSFAQPCTRLNVQGSPPGVDSGFVPVPANSTTLPQWSFNVTNASAPLWFYCAQKAPTDHCAAGMVFAINPTADKTFDAFQATAKGGSPPASTTPAPSGSVMRLGMSVGAMAAFVIAVAGVIL